MDERRPGPVNPPAPEGLITMTVKLNTNKVRQAIGINEKSQHEWIVPQYHLVFCDLNQQATGEHLEVTVDMRGWNENCSAKCVGVTIDNTILSDDFSLFTIAVAGAVTIAASCDDNEVDSITYTCTGDTLWWNNVLDVEGFSCAPQGLNTMKIVGKGVPIPVVTAAQLRAIDPIYADVGEDDDAIVSYNGKNKTVAVLKQENLLWKVCAGQGGKLGMLLAKGNFNQHEVRVLLSL